MSPHNPSEKKREYFQSCCLTDGSRCLRVLAPLLLVPLPFTCATFCLTVEEYVYAKHRLLPNRDCPSFIPLGLQLGSAVKWFKIKKTQTSFSLDATTERLIRGQTCLMFKIKYTSERNT